MREVTFKTLSGKEFTVKFDCKRYMYVETFDGVELPAKLTETSEISTVYAGNSYKLMFVHSKASKIPLSDSDKKFMADHPECYAIIAFNDVIKGTIVFAVNEEEYNRFMDTEAADLDANTTDDARKALDAKTAKAESSKIASAKKILAGAHTTMHKADGSLMTNAEAKEWSKRYNDINNEGGEGFVPEIITVEEVKYAKQILEEE
jgi:hypothetical protein